MLLHAAQPPRPPQPTATGPNTQPPRGGNLDPALLGKLAALGQGTLVEELARNARDADAYVDKLCEEGRRLREKPPLPGEPGTKHDAAAFMAALIDYESPLDNPPGYLHLRPDLAARLRSYGPDWPARITDTDLAGLDFDWLVQLRRYDHWTLLGAGRLRNLPPKNLFNDPIPNYEHLLYWAKLRYALAFRRSDLPAAVGEVRHLAMLVHTQGLLVAESVATAIARCEARAHEFAIASGADVWWWDAPAPEQIERQRHAAFASLYFSYPGVGEATVREAAACTPAPCAMLIEGAAANRAFSAYGASDNWALIGSLVERYGCETAVLQRIRQSPPLPAPEAVESLREDVGERIANNLGPL